jgi:RNA polymerase sigma-70 factor (ECF subfamily)
MNQDPTVAATDWERFREFLLLLARMQADARWQGKLDLSGVVQQTLLEAYQDGKKLAEATDAQKAAWLKRALANNLADELRKLTTARRDAGRERSLQVDLDQSHSRLELLLPDAHRTPSSEAVKAERGIQLAKALTTLPEAQRQVIELHHLQGHTLVQVAEALGTTKPAVAGLLHRGLKTLRRLLEPDESHK